MPHSRKQLSLYFPADAAAQIEAVRWVVDPVQSSLIPAHVTLCRDGELNDLDAVRARSLGLTFGPLTLRFGPPIVFGGHGILLECIEGEEQFRALRQCVLDSDSVPEQRPHVTLAHPRNPKASGNSLENALILPEVIEITFPSIRLIEQEGSDPWRVLETFELR